MYGLTFVHDVSWNDVWNAWRQREEELWRRHVAELGLTWDTWREKNIAPFSLDKRTWKEYRIDDPKTFVPQMWIGGFKGWKKYLNDPDKPTRFFELVENSAVTQNKKVRAIMNDFPNPTTIMAVQFGDEFVLGEGMHRCSAISIAAKDGRQIVGDLFLHTFELDPSETSLFDMARTGMPTHDR